MAQASVERISYIPGERLRVTFSLEPGELPSFEVSNISTNVLRVDVARDSLLIGFGSAPVQNGDQFTVEVDLPNNATPGLHFVASGAVLMGGDMDGEQRRLQFDPPTFEIRPVIAAASTEAQYRSQRERLLRERQAFSERRHRTPQATGDLAQDRRFRVLVFAVGTLIHSTQQLEGYCIVQLPGGMSHQQMLNLANTYVPTVGFGPIPLSDQVEQAFARGTPSIVVDYADIQARDHDDAISYCRQHADLVFLALGRDRGQVPKEFGFAAYAIGTDQMWHWFHAPWYRGNLVSTFSPTAVAEAVERMLPKLQTDPFARLISRTYVEAATETQDAERIFRLWTILELAADRHMVPNNTPLIHPSGAQILKANGRPETNERKAGRVYSYLLTVGDMATTATHLDGELILEGGDTSHPNYQPGMRFHSLWEMTRAAYAVRNYIAHEGHFDRAAAAAGDQYQQLAAQALTTGKPMLADFVELAAARVLAREA